MTSKILFDAIEDAQRESVTNQKAAQHNLIASVDDIVPYDNSAFLDMVSLVLESLREKTLVGKT